MLPRLAGGGNLVHFLNGLRLFDLACVPADKLVNDPGWPGGLYAKLTSRELVELDPLCSLLRNSRIS